MHTLEGQQPGQRPRIPFEDPDVRARMKSEIGFGNDTPRSRPAGRSEGLVNRSRTDEEGHSVIPDREGSDVFVERLRSAERVVDAAQTTVNEQLDQRMRDIDEVSGGFASVFSSMEELLGTNVSALKADMAAEVKADRQVCDKIRDALRYSAAELSRVLAIVARGELSEANVSGMERTCQNYAENLLQQIQRFTQANEAAMATARAIIFTSLQGSKEDRITALKKNFGLD